MPELPDVEVFKRYIDSTSLHKRIDGVDAKAPEILKDVGAKQLKESLDGDRLEATRRHGKYLFVKTGQGHWLVLHFGMTGFFKYFKKDEKEPPHDRLLITLNNGFHLAYDSQRKLGEVRLIDDLESFIEENGLGPDALDEKLDFAAFRKILFGSRATVKSALMDQRRIAGIGNVYSDEILFQAGIHPKVRGDRLDEGRLKDLHESMKNVLQTAVDSKADPERFPDDYITGHRRGDRKCPKCSGEIKKIKISGRTGYFCPQCQNHQEKE